MSNYLGNFVWYELLTEDCNAAKNFYSQVIGWEAQDAGMTDHAYIIVSAGQYRIGGLMDIPADARALGVKPCWTGYIGVDDVGAYTQRVQDAGGKLLRPEQEIPGVGRFAVVADLHGAVFILFSAACDQPPERPPMGTVGQVGWHELSAGDGPAAFDFYSGLFGWSKAEAIDMGPMGVYQTFSAGADPIAIGGVMTKMPQTPAPFWQFYFNVEAIDSAA
jgi:predicted enzyme related to lactoylglutathione lyase